MKILFGNFYNYFHNFISPEALLHNHFWRASKFWVVFEDISASI